MQSSLLRADSMLATATLWHPQADGGVIVESRQDVEDIVDACKAQYNDTDERARWADNDNLVARIPLTIYFDLHRRGIIDDPKAMRRWLNDPDNRHFRTRPGRL